ncbi:putative multidrug resistance protein MdtD [Andreprevotia sp. IGB-42]|uniref:multidrug transporter subunit MdtD n=1 Tax=Andreprevotia sp. IGB-42 TaxID=2497473 RepID=UPI00135CC964|nr:multidrug transporter subunit MdtD [Andreprevotia sp. IGB-42]KAF0815464.1 putative multidrug resistance protein MdtD [Andreprevotia sp. IGB-42]
MESTPPPQPAANNMLIWLVAIGFFMQTLDSTIVNTALPSMAAALGESPLRMQSVVISYALTVALLIPASGWLADKFGTRKIFFGAILLFTLGSLLCALSGTLTQLVASRVLQGIGGAMLLPVGRLAVLRAVPRDRFLDAMSMIAIPGMLGPLVGPTLGGWLVEAASWHWIFLINIPVGVVGCIATFRLMPDFRAAEHTRFDATGFILLAAGMLMLTLSLEGLAELGMQQATVAVLLVFGLVAIAAYWLHATRVPAPLFPPSLFRTHSYAVGLLGNLFARLGIGAMPLLLPLLLQVSFGFSPFQAGMSMIPMVLAGMVTRQLVSPSVKHWGYRNVLVANTILLGVLIASFALLTPTTPAWLRVAMFAAFGAANAVQFTAMNTLALKDLDPAQASSGNGLLSVIMQLAMALGVAAGAAVLGLFSHHYNIPHGSGSTLQAFHATFICVGVMTAAASGIFFQLASDTSRQCPRTQSDVE